MKLTRQIHNCAYLDVDICTTQRTEPKLDLMHIQITTFLKYCGLSAHADSIIAQKLNCKKNSLSIYEKVCVVPYFT